MNYLKAGIGDPCAGQLMENIKFSMTLKVPKVSEEVGNIGLADPIGSKMPRCVKNEWLIELGLGTTGTGQDGRERLLNFHLKKKWMERAIIAYKIDLNSTVHDIFNQKAGIRICKKRKEI